jgi:hypothetical protein
MIKRIVIITLFCIFLIISGLFAQDTWMKTYQPFGDVDYYVEDVLVCSDGGYAINGYYYEIDNIIPPPIAEQFGFLMKTDSDGSFQWAQIDYDFDIGLDWNQSSAFIETDDEGFLCSVYSDYGGSVLVKRDSEGAQQWVESCGDFYIHSMDKTNDGYIILGGRMNGLPAIRKITQEADILWTQDYHIQGSGSGCIKSIISLTSNGYAVTGWESSNGGDVFVMKTNTDGDSLWTSIYETSYGGNDAGYSVIQTANGNYFVVGRIELTNNYGGVIIKYDENGDTLWTKNEPSEICNNFSSVIGIIDGIVTYGTGNSILTNLYKYDLVGENIWYSPISYICGAWGDRCLQVYNENGFIVTGSTEINWEDNILKILSRQRRSRKKRTVRL